MLKNFRSERQMRRDRTTDVGTAVRAPESRETPLQQSAGSANVTEARLSARNRKGSLS